MFPLLVVTLRIISRRENGGYFIPPLFLLVRMRSEPDVLIQKNPREALFTRLSCSYCVQLILALKEGGLGGRRGEAKKRS